MRWQLDAHETLRCQRDKGDMRLPQALHAFQKRMLVRITIYSCSTPSRSVTRRSGWHLLQLATAVALCPCSSTTVASTRCGMSKTFSRV